MTRRYAMHLNITSSASTPTSIPLLPVVYVHLSETVSYYEHVGNSLVKTARLDSYHVKKTPMFEWSQRRGVLLLSLHN